MGKPAAGLVCFVLKLNVYSVRRAGCWAVMWLCLLHICMKVGRRFQQPTHLSPSGPTEAKIVNLYFGVHVEVANLLLEAVRKHARTSVLHETD